MSEQLTRSPNLQLTADYLAAVVAVTSNPADVESYDGLMELEPDMMDRFMQYPVNSWNLSRGYEPISLSDGITSSREKILADETYVMENFLSNTRAVLISLGKRIPLSGSLDSSAFTEAYELIGKTLDEMSGGDKDFKSFAFDRIRRDLYREYQDSRIGYNTTQLDSDTLELNIKTALKTIGYPYGILGKAVLGTMGFLPRYESEWSIHNNK